MKTEMNTSVSNTNQNKPKKKASTTNKSKRLKVKNELYDNFEVKMLLKISDSTLRRYRNSNHLVSTKIGNKYFYPAAQFKDLIKKTIQSKKRKSNKPDST